MKLSCGGGRGSWVQTLCRKVGCRHKKNRSWSLAKSLMHHLQCRWNEAPASRGVRVHRCCLSLVVTARPPPPLSPPSDLSSHHHHHPPTALLPSFSFSAVQDGKTHRATTCIPMFKVTKCNCVCDAGSNGVCIATVPTL